MSIGSCTCIVKRDGAIEAHIIEGWLLDHYIQDGCKKKGQTVFQLFKKSIAGWKKAERTGLTEDDIERLAVGMDLSDSPDDLGYVAGDRYFIVDFDKQAVFVPKYKRIDDPNGRRTKWLRDGWEELTVDSPKRG